jgi:signal transduction histidine kinase
MRTGSIDFRMLASGAVQAREYKAGEVIFKKGDIGRELFIVQSGKIKIFQDERILETLSEYGVFGEMALIDSAPRSATAVAITDAKLIPVNEEQFSFFIANAPHFVLDVMRLLTRRVRERDRAYELVNVDAIIGSIAHEIRQPLSAITANAGAALRLLEKASPDYIEVREILRRILTQGHEASDLFDGIRTLFKKVDAERAPVDVNVVASEVLEALRTDFTEHGVTARLELTSGLPFVEGNRNQLHQVVFNLVQNAMEAMSTTSDMRRVLKVSTELAGRDAIALAVQDSGPGIKTEQVGQVFDAFFTTKANGMGLGLAICRTIVLRHGGQLTVSSGDERGALFELVLPILTSEKATARSE